MGEATRFEWTIFLFFSINRTKVFNIPRENLSQNILLNHLLGFLNVLWKKSYEIFIWKNRINLK